ncbi:MAG: hypothetical protein ABH831_00415 [Candidatus Nealsonbacteria bacterium]
MRNQLKESILDIFFPKRCVNCGKEGTYICEDCTLFFSETPVLKLTGETEELMSVWEYEGVLKKILNKIKSEGIHGAVQDLIKIAFKMWEIEIPEDTCITFVPLWKNKEKERGFNQARIIAEVLAKKTNIKVVNLLKKNKNTPYQDNLDMEQRLKNVKSSFSAKKLDHFPEKIILVDDFSISGATIEECSRELKRAGAKKVWGFVLARSS